MPSQAPKPLLNTADLWRSPLKRSLYGLVKSPLEKVLGVERLNALYDQVRGEDQSPAQFAESVLNLLNIQYSFDEQRLAELRAIQGPLVIVSNHPLGGLEAIFLVALMGRIRPDYRIMANYFLGQVAEVRPNLILVDPFDTEESKQKNINPLKEVLGYLRSGGFLGVFPAGEVAALKARSGRIEEPDWNPNIAKIILKTRASVVPVYFHGTNSVMFHMASLLNPRIRTSLLIREFVNPKVRKLNYRIGELIGPDKLAEQGEPEAVMQYLRSRTYLLGVGQAGKKPRIKLQLIKLPFARRAVVEEIIQPVEPERIRAEVARFGPQHLLLSQKEYDVFCFRAQEAPNLLREIGRLREVTFREIGEGSGRAIDLDHYDQAYLHLIIWQRTVGEVVGAYRMARTDQILAQQGPRGLYTNTLFRIEPALWRQIQPALELGRSFVRPEYQRSFWPLLLLWMGIGRYLNLHPQYTHLIGPVSITNSFSYTSLNLMVNYLKETSVDESLKDYVRAKHPFHLDRKITDIYNSFYIQDIKDVQELIDQIDKSELKIPPLLKHYLKMGGRILAFNVDPDFNDVLDALMVVDMTKAPDALMVKYLGDEGMKNYKAFHASTGTEG
jgi:putative hemolysin